MDTMTRPYLPLMAEASADLGIPYEDLCIDITLDPPTSRRHMTAFKLYGGQVDEDVVELYAYAACARLAGAAHELSGWTMRAVKTAKTYQITSPNIGFGSILIHHVGVQTPGGWFMDVTGTREDLEVTTTYSAGWVADTDVAEMVSGNAYAERWDSGLEGTPFREFTLYLAHTLIQRALNEGQFSTL
jgi:hypothetical protein